MARHPLLPFGTLLTEASASLVLQQRRRIVLDISEFDPVAGVISSVCRNASEDSSAQRFLLVLIAATCCLAARTLE